MVKHLFSSGYSGLRAWLLQRATALVMAVYAVLMLVLLLLQAPLHYDNWQALFLPLWMRIATALFLFSLYAHAWLGMRDILKDYVQHLKIRNGLQKLVVLLLIVYAIWTIKILWGHAS